MRTNQVIIFQQGSGSRILSAYLTGEVWPEPFTNPLGLQDTKKIVEKGEPFRISYRHLEQNEALYELLKDWEVIHLYRDPGRTFTREIAKYDLKVTKQDLKNYIAEVERMRKKVNEEFTATITHYEDFIRELYLGNIREFDHL